MNSPSDQPDQTTKLLGQLEQTSCFFCDAGHLARERYKGNEAVVCTDCGTPGAQVWIDQ